VSARPRPWSSGARPSGAFPQRVNIFGSTGRGLGRPELTRAVAWPRGGDRDQHHARLPARRRDRLSGAEVQGVGRVHADGRGRVPNVLVSLKDDRRCLSGGCPGVRDRGCTATRKRHPMESSSITRATKDDLLRHSETGSRDQPVRIPAVDRGGLRSSGRSSTCRRSSGRRDFAVFKATGTSNLDIVGDLAVQAVMLSIAAAAVGALVATALAPKFPLPVVVPPSALPAVARGSGSRGRTRQWVRLAPSRQIDPALAFGSA